MKTGVSTMDTKRRKANKKSRISPIRTYIRSETLSPDFTIYVLRKRDRSCTCSPQGFIQKMNGNNSSAYN